MHDIAELWEQHGVYLNTATYGLPPKTAYDATLAALEDWRTGRTSEDGWEACTERARATFAKLVNVPHTSVVCGATVSELIGLVAASLPDGARVLIADNDFASTIFPFTVHAARGITVDSVPLANLVETLSESYAIIVVSHVQAYSGEVADLQGLVEKCARTKTLLCVDATQSCGWLQTDASEVDFYVCHAYKWLASPRGSAFMAVRKDRLQSLIPLHAGWWATDDPNNNLFGLPNRISKETARRLDSSPAWFSWVGTDAALRAIFEIGIDVIEAHNMKLARRFCDKTGLPAPASPIVYMKSSGSLEKLHAAGIRASVRAGRTRLSFHIYNTEHDVDRTIAALA
ncbi:MAG TPA: aminotransferase class V-fold PLP-dependent enzyme [Candidatus Eremiobacteraceae bacterium]|nr:aminotransferase class V-fold PLP-dependent enzyme [Candidatus Eremiobacteraceae bacterium]